MTGWRKKQIKECEMTQDEIIEMARQASFTKPFHEFFPQLDVYVLEAFAKLVAAKEREACAKVCEVEMEPYCGFDKESYAGGRALTTAAAAIRARGQA
jgi:hypothetical protein